MRVKAERISSSVKKFHKGMQNALEVINRPSAPYWFPSCKFGVARVSATERKQNLADAVKD
jgi:hypothetical protein